MPIDNFGSWMYYEGGNLVLGPPGVTIPDLTTPTTTSRQLQTHGGLTHNGAHHDFGPLSGVVDEDGVDIPGGYGELSVPCAHLASPPSSTPWPTTRPEWPDPESDLFVSMDSGATGRSDRAFAGFEFVRNEQFAAAPAGTLFSPDNGDALEDGTTERIWHSVNDGLTWTPLIPNPGMRTHFDGSPDAVVETARSPWQ
jgi:hypothetical protein